MPGSKARWKTAFRVLLVAGAAALFASVFLDADVHRVTELVGAVGMGGLLVVLLPQAAALGAESYGWKLSIRLLRREVGFFPLFRVRVATEALTLSLPAGAVFGETVKPYLLSRHCGLSVSDGVAALVARKYLLLASQAATLLVVATLGFATLQSVSVGLVGVRGLEWIALAAGGALAMGAALTAAWLRRSTVAKGVFAVLAKVPVRPLARWLGASERRFSETDRSVSGFFAHGCGRHAVPALWFTLGWFFELLETAVILRVLGVDQPFIAAACLEVLATLVRHVVFVVPAGLGVQDLGYVAGLAALGVPDAGSLGAAFVLIKRTKDLGWIALGYLLLGSAAGLRHPEQPVVARSSA